MNIIFQILAFLAMAFIQFWIYKIGFDSIVPMYVAILVRGIVLAIWGILAFAIIPEDKK